MTLAAYYHCYHTSGASAHEYLGNAVRISFLASVEQEIYQAFKFFTVFFTTSGFEPSYWLTGEWYTCSDPTILQPCRIQGKSLKRFSLTPCGYEMVADKMVWGVILRPH